MSENIDFNKLGQVIDTTWGRSSTTNGTSQTVKVRIKSDKYIEVIYCSVVNMTREHLPRDMKEKYVSEANEVIKAVIKKLKEDYKEIAESSITTKQVAEDSSIEFISSSIYNSKKTAYFRRNVVFEIQ